jgi:tape measure domain-containing protein
MADVTVRFVLDDQVSDKADKIAKSLRKIAGLEGGGGKGGDGEAKRAEESRIKRFASFAKTMITLGKAASDAYKAFGDLYPMMESFARGPLFKKLFGAGTRQRALFDFAREKSRAKNEMMARKRHYNFLMEENGLTAAEAYNASGMARAAEKANGQGLQYLGGRAAAKALPAAATPKMLPAKSIDTVATSGPVTVTGSLVKSKGMEKATETGFVKGAKKAAKLPEVRAPGRHGLPGMPVSTAGIPGAGAPGRHHGGRTPGRSFMNKNYATPKSASELGKVATPSWIKSIHAEEIGMVASAKASKKPPLVKNLTAAEMGVTRLGKKADSISPTMKKLGLFAGGAGAVLGAVGLTMGIGAAIGAIQGLVGIVTGALAKVKDLAVSIAQTFTKAAVSAGMFRESTLLGLKAMLKSDEAAKGVYNSAVKMAGKTPFSTQQVVDAYKTLLGYGFAAKDLDKTFTALGDMAAVKGDSSYIQRLGLVMGQIRGKGRLQGEELMQLAEAGLGQGAVYAALAKRLEVSEDEVMKMVTAGEVKSDVAIETILKVIQDKFGGAMGDLSKSLGGLWSTLTSRPFELFNAAFDKGGVMGGIYEKIKGFAKFISAALDPNTKTGARIVAIFQQFADVLGQVFNIGGPEDFSAAFSKVLTVIETIMPYLKDFAAGFVKGFAKEFTKLGPIFGMIGDTPADKWAGLAKAIVYIAGALGKLTAHGIWALAAAMGVLAGIVAATTGAMLAVDAVFTAILDGVISLVGWITKLISTFLTLTGVMSLTGTPLTDLLSGAATGGNSTFPMSPGGSPLVRNSDVPMSASAAAGGGGNHSFVVNISGAGLTPDELMARARAEMSRMIEEALP